MRIKNKMNNNVIHIIILIIALYFLYLWLKNYYSRLIKFHSPSLIMKSKYPQKVDYQSSYKILITGLIRDCEKQIPIIKRYISALGNSVKDWRLLIVENDSFDNTRKCLLNWAFLDSRVILLGCEINSLKCNMKIPKTTEHDIYLSRIKKMVYLRNIYLNYI